MMHRRDFLAGMAWGAGGLALGGLTRSAFAGPASDPLFKISLAEWSLHRALFAGEKDHLDFARMARQDYGIEAVEYVNVFFMDRAKDEAYLREMKTRADGEGVRSLLIMCDREGNLGDPDDAARTQAVENHYKWVEAAAFLGRLARRGDEAGGPSARGHPARLRQLPHQGRRVV